MRYPIAGVITVTCCIIVAITTAICYIVNGEMNTVSQFLADMGLDPLFAGAITGLLVHWFGGIMTPRCPRCGWPDKEKVSHGS